MARYLDQDDPDGGYGGEGSGSTGGGGGTTPPSTGTTNLATVKWYRLPWEFTEPEPKGILTGFELAIFTGDDPDTGVLAMPIVAVDDPAARRWIDKLELRAQIDLRAAVRAVYGTKGKSAWCPPSSIATFLPDNVSLSAGGAPSYRKLSDGTILQFLVSPQQTTETSITVNWAIPFPNACLVVQATAQNVNGTYTADTWYQVIGYNQTGATLFRQSSNGDSSPTKAHVLAIGY